MHRRIVILGATGMIGHKMLVELRKNVRYDVIGSSRRSFDDDTYVTDLLSTDGLIKLIKNVRPNIIINCSGKLIQESETNPHEAIYLNSYVPRYLQHISNQYNFRIIQMSTDCVFSGDNGPYDVSSIKNATNIYGQTKGLGEITSSPHLTIRTSVIGPDYYEDGTELFHWFINQQKTVNGFTKAIWSGVTTLQLAQATGDLIEKEFEGLFHLSSNIPISKYELLKTIRGCLDKRIDIRKIDGTKTNKCLIDKTSYYDKDSFSYKRVINEMIDDMRESSSYKHYTN